MGTLRTSLNRFFFSSWHLREGLVCIFVGTLVWMGAYHGASVTFDLESPPSSLRSALFRLLFLFLGSTTRPVLAEFRHVKSEDPIHELYANSFCHYTRPLWPGLDSKRPTSWLLYPPPRIPEVACHLLHCRSQHARRKERSELDVGNVKRRKREEKTMGISWVHGDEGGSVEGYRPRSAQKRRHTPNSANSRRTIRVASRSGAYDP